MVPALDWERKETQAAQTRQAALQAPWCVQRARSQEISASVVAPVQQESSVRWVQGRARPEAPAVARPVPVWQEVRPSKERKASVFAGPAQPVQNAPEESQEGSEPREALPSAGAAEVAPTVAVLQGPAFAAAVRAVGPKGDSRPEERPEIWAPASVPAWGPVSAPA